MPQTLAGVPTGTVLAGSYGSGLAPVDSRLALAPTGVSAVPGDLDWQPPFEFSDRHCHWVDTDDKGRESQCGSWPVKADNPDHYCAGHLRKVKASGADSGPDQDVRTSAS